MEMYILIARCRASACHTTRRGNEADVDRTRNDNSYLRCSPWQRKCAAGDCAKGGKLLTVSHGTIENGVLVIENGKITAVGSAAEVKIPANARVQDVSGMTVYPGLIDSESYLGLTEISAEQMTNDLIELSDEIMPHMHVYDAFHAES